MDGNWILPIVPTINPSGNDALFDSFVELFPEFRKLSNNEFVVDQIKGLTSQLVDRQSYCPSTWTSRAYNLLRMGFPDLAIGDAYKATLLIDRYVSGPRGKLKVEVTKQLWRQTKESRPLRTAIKDIDLDQPARIQEYVEFVQDRASLILAQALFVAQCYVECFEFLKDYEPEQFSSERFSKLKELAERAQMVEDLARMNEGQYVHNMDIQSLEARRSGSISPQSYPWSASYIRRSELTQFSSRTLIDAASESKCCIAPSSIINVTATDNEVEKGAWPLGVMAQQDCNLGERLFLDHTFLSGVDNPADRCSCCRKLLDPERSKIFQTDCCDAHLCSTLCASLAINNYHSASCGAPLDLNDESPMRLSAADVSSDTRATNDLLYRMFAHLECTPAVHPLRTGVLSGMVPAYRNKSPVSFSFINDIKRPLMMLNMLENDIFKDHALDTWVIQTIQARIRNNIRAYEDENEAYHVAINLYYMFLNHSCDPNVEIKQHNLGSSTLAVYATKAIRKGDELSVSYLDSEDLDLPYAERQELLKDWTGGRCLCDRCRHDRAQLDNRDEDQRTESSDLVSVFQDDPEDEDYEDFGDEDDEHGDDYESPRSRNRYATRAALLANHPTMKSLQRQTPSWERQYLPFDYEKDVYCPESPTGKRQKTSATEID